jgi:hypothetical protein
MVRNFPVRTHHGTVAAEFRSQTLNDLIRLLASAGIDDFDPRPMLAPFRDEPLLPSVEDDRHGVSFPMTVGSQLLDQRLTRHLRVERYASTRTIERRQEIIPIDDQMQRHSETLRSTQYPVNSSGSGLFPQSP